MSFLDRLIPEHQEVMIRLPYRVGLWISRADMEGGEDAARQERQTLESLIEGFSRDVFGAVFIQEIMAVTIAGKGDWKSWGAELDYVPSECRRALGILESTCTDKESREFITRLMDIAEAVAYAFQERNAGRSILGRFWLRLCYGCLCFTGFFTRTPRITYHSYLYVSPKERKALRSISQALGVST